VIEEEEKTPQSNEKTMMGDESPSKFLETRGENLRTQEDLKSKKGSSDSGEYTTSKEGTRPSSKNMQWR